MIRLIRELCKKAESTGVQMRIAVLTTHEATGMQYSDAFDCVDWRADVGGKAKIQIHPTLNELYGIHGDIYIFDDAEMFPCEYWTQIIKPALAIGARAYMASANCGADGSMLQLARASMPASSIFTCPIVHPPVDE